MNILIADDEKYSREDLRKALGRVSPDHEVFLAEDFDSALKVLAEADIDLAFLDIQMPGKTGIELAKEIKGSYPGLNIIFVTAYADYALDALRLYVSGYLLKPVIDSELKEALENLRMPLSREGTGTPPQKREPDIFIKCFGNFEVFLNDKPFHFTRQKEKELLAYLVCLKGSSATRSEICANLFEEGFERKNTEYLKKIVSFLKKDLQSQNAQELLVHTRNSYAINTELFYCDYYDFLTGDSTPEKSFRGEFLSQYSWAEKYIWGLENY